MLIFIALSLALAFMVQTANPLQQLLVTPILIYIGLAFALISILGGFLKKLKSPLSYDIFASSTLLVWFAYWKPLFNDDAPIFFFYPLYFALMTAGVTLFFISPQHKIDDDSRHIMQALAKKGIIQPWLVMLGVLGSLTLEQHFMLYPVMMTLLVMRFTLEMKVA